MGGLAGVSLNVWLGATDLHSEGNWSWLDQTPMDYVRWGPGQPNNRGVGQHCMRKEGADLGKWDDSYCSLFFPYLCKKTVL